MVRSNTLPRSALIAGLVLGLHAAGLWVLSGSLALRPIEVLVPMHMLAEWVDSPRAAMPAVSRPTPPVPKPPVRQPRALAPASKPRPQPAQRPEPAPLAMEPSPIVSATSAPSTKDATPPDTRKTAAAQSATSTATAQSNTPPQAMPIAAAPAPAVPAPAPVTLELPFSDAQYLQNPKPNYPNQSKRLGEQGTVLIRVLVSDKGAAKEAHIQTSSGFFRLDNAALSTVLTWRFVPGKRAGIAESMWFTVPIRFGLQ